MAAAEGDLLAAVVALCDRASEVVMAAYAGGVTARRKADASPVTAADEAAEAVLVAGLRRLTPDVPIVAEEAVAAGRVPPIAGARFWLVDPLDGTKEFLSRNGEFTVNVGLIDAGRPLLGAVAAPALGRCWWGRVGAGARARTAGGGVRAIAVRAVPPEGATVLVSRSHLDPDTEDHLRRYRIAGRRAAGSALKFCLLAAGEADLYPRCGPTMEWDTAAGHAVLAAAGGAVTTADGAPLRYGKPAFRNPGFVAVGDQGLAAR